MRRRTMTFGSGNANSSSNVESVDVFYTDNREEAGFIEGEPKVKNTVATFNFAMNNEKEGRSSAPVDTEAKKPISEVVETKKQIPEPVETKKTAFEFITASKSSKAGLKGLTPPIGGENFSVKRGYQFRPSTLRKLNELKTKHPDLDVYLNTIIDAAILHYYNYIMNEGGKF